MTKIRNKKLCNLFFLFIINLFFINNIHPQVGEVKWRVPTNIIGWSSPAIGPDGAVYIGDNDGYLYAVVDEGETWSFKWEPIKLADDVGECCPTLSEDGKILYNNNPNKINGTDGRDGRHGINGKNGGKGINGNTGSKGSNGQAGDPGGKGIINEITIPVGPIKNPDKTFYLKGNVVDLNV